MAQGKGWSMVKGRYKKKITRPRDNVIKMMPMEKLGGMHGMGGHESAGIGRVSMDRIKKPGM